MTSIVLYGAATVLLIISFIKDKSKTKQALKTGLKSFENIMPQFLGIIFIVGISLSLLNTETISKIIGPSSGFLGILLSAVVGAITIMPTFVAFSMGNSLLNSGAGFGPVSAIVSTLTLVGIVTYGLEAKFIGKKAAFLRNFIAFLASILVALIMERVMVIIC